MEKRKTILITGATSGIGCAVARKYAAMGYRLILTGRRQERLLQLNNELLLLPHCEVLTLCFDVRQRHTTEQIVSELPPDWQTIDLLINNAGLASGLSPLQEGDIDDWELMIDTNIKGLLYVTRSIVPGMIERGSGQIINVGSIAGREAYGKGNVYCATKFAVSALTDSMRIDLNGTNIRVGQIQPGAVNTEFSTVRFHGNTSKANAVYEGFQPLVAEDVADAILYMSEAPAHVNVAEMLLLPTAQAAATLLARK